MKKTNPLFLFVGLSVVFSFLVSGCGDFGKGKQLRQEIDRLSQEIQLKDSNIRALTDKLKEKQDALDIADNKLNTALKAKQDELDTANSKLNGTQQELDTLRKQFDTANKLTTAQIISAEKNITMGEVRGVVNFDEPFDNFVGNIKVRDLRFWVDNNTVFEGVTSISGLREGDKVSILFYDRGINKIATHIRLVK